MYADILNPLLMIFSVMYIFVFVYIVFFKRYRNQGLRLLVALAMVVFYFLVVMSSYPFLLYKKVGEAEYLWNVTVAYETVVYIVHNETTTTTTSTETVTTTTVVPATVKSPIYSKAPYGFGTFGFALLIGLILSFLLFAVAVEFVVRVTRV